MNDIFAITLFQKTFLVASGMQAILSLLIGLFYCFFGHKHFRSASIASSVYLGFIVGISISGRLIHHGIIDLVIGIILAIALAFLAYYLPAVSFSLFFGVVIFDLISLFVSAQNAAIVIAVVFAIALFVLMRINNKAISIILTSLLGALYFSIAFCSIIEINLTSYMYIAWIVGILIVGIIGTIIQYRLNPQKNNKVESKKTSNNNEQQK